MGRTLSEDLEDDFEQVFMNPDEFGSVVTHTARDQSTFDVACVWTPMMGGRLIDDGVGRRFATAGILVVSKTTSTGDPTVIDDQGLFTIEGSSWQIESVTPVAGGITVEVKRDKIKTTRTLRPNR